MLSYRHGYHAGNHADVVKHLVLLGLVQKLQEKDKPFSLIDSHSGGGLYDLFSSAAALNSEHESGIVRLWGREQKNPLLALYLDHVRSVNTGQKLRYYPGSPVLARACLRADDRMHLLELHPVEIEALREQFAGDRQVSIHHRDAFEGLLAISPPEPRRGLVLIDPSYENKEDYQRVLAAIVKVHHRWPVAIIALWYPLLARQRDRSVWLRSAMLREHLPDLLSIELTVLPQEEEFGMHGSGMLIVNSPWQFKERIESTLRELVGQMGSGASAKVIIPG
jgi:23S rRNA (adenine2030-N6)-methyltransferase